MPATIIRVSPFKTKDSRTMGGDNLFSFIQPFSHLSQFAKIAADVFQAFGCEPENLWLRCQRIERLRDFVAGRSADLAERLSENVGWRKLPQELLVHLI